MFHEALRRWPCRATPFHSSTTAVVSCGRSVPAPARPRQWERRVPVRPVPIRFQGLKIVALLENSASPEYLLKALYENQLNDHASSVAKKAHISRDVRWI